MRCRGEATAWRQRTAVDAVGGIVSRSGAYRIHTFTENGVFTMGEDAFVEILLVGGGGGGGAGALSGGGGAGGEVRHITDRVLAAGSYSVTVGAGGQGAHTNSSGTITADLRSSAGGQSTFLFSGTVTDGDWTKERLTFYAEGGAPGGVGNGGGGTAHLKGFNGGGASAWCQESASHHAGGVATSDRGFAGGASTNLSAVCGFSGGGGGAGQAGNDGVYPRGDTGGRGGDGIACDITGEIRYYGGGGGGGYSDNHLSGNASRNQDVLGGAGGGGNGSGWLNNSYAYPGGDGEPNTGGGGGGGGACPVGSGSVKPKGGDGGSGVVIVRYLRKPRGFIFSFR